MPRYSEELVNEIRQSTDIVSLISEYAKLTRKRKKLFWALSVS